MTYVYSRSYRGGLKGVILDWAGTTIDFGCLAPVVAFIEVFRARGVEVTDEQAREPMGLHKRDHIRAITKMPSIEVAWLRAHGRAVAADDIEEMYRAFVPVQLRVLGAHARLIPGTLEAVADFRRRGFKIGTTTGYSAEMMAALLPAAREQGYSPDAMVCASDVTEGRPAPWMCYRNAAELGVYPMVAMVKIGDTVADVEEGLNAGMWTIALSRCGNEVGLSEEALGELTADAQRDRVERARRRLAQAGAHYVVDGPLDCIAVLDSIEVRIRQGERP